MAATNPDFNTDGSNGSTVTFGFTPSSVNAEEAVNFKYTVDIADEDSTLDLNAEVKAFLYVNGTIDNVIVDSQQTISSENETVKGSLSHKFNTNKSVRNIIEESPLTSRYENDSNKFNSYPRTDEPIWIKVEIRYFGAGDYSKGGDYDEVLTTKAITMDVKNPFDAPESPEQPTLSDPGTSNLSETFKDRVSFAIRDIEFESDVDYLDLFENDEINDNDGGRTYNILFDYGNPTVAIDGAGRFVKHEIIGGATVRQKIGEDPINLSINGVCKQGKNSKTANQIDMLRDAKHGSIYSDRLPGSNSSLRVHFGSTSTEPMTDGGAANLKDAELLYSFQINAIEVNR